MQSPTTDTGTKLAIAVLLSLALAVAYVLAFARPAAAATDPANLNWATIYAGNPAAAQTPPQARQMARPSDITGTPARAYARVRVLAWARQLGLPGELALAVATHESGLRCQVRGAAGELGPLQIKPATARMIGYRGPIHELNSCEAGIEWGLRHLALAYRRCGTATGAAGLHNRGLGSHCGASRYTVAVLAIINGRSRWAIRREYA